MIGLSALYLIFTFITFFVMGWVTIYTLRHQDVPGARRFFWICMLTCLLSLLDGLSMVGPNKDWALRWFNLRFIALAFAPVAWLIFVFRYTNMTKWLGSPLMAILFIIPLITQVMIWTNGSHALWVAKPVDFHQADCFFWCKPARGSPVPGHGSIWLILTV
jgi:hypothetical protein